MSLQRDLLHGVIEAAQLIIGYQAPADPEASRPATVRNSFAALLFCLPAAGFIRWLAWRDSAVPAPLWHAIAVNLLLYLIGWIGFLLLCRPLLRLLGQTGAWPRVVTVWNWCNVAQFTVLTGTALFELFHASSFVLNVAGLVSLFWQSWIEYRALRPLSGSAWGAGGLVAVDFAIGVLVQAALVSLGG